MGRNTAPAIAVAALQAQATGGDPLLLVLPSDHVIRDEAGFRSAVLAAAPAAETGALVTFGIVPTHGHTGLGYIHRGDALAPFKGAYKVQAFKEKPDKATADRYAESGRYYWNSGMFVWRADAFMKELMSVGSADDGAST